MDWRAVGIGVLGAAAMVAAMISAAWVIGLMENHPLLVFAAAFVFMAGVFTFVSWRR